MSEQGLNAEDAHRIASWVDSAAAVAAVLDTSGQVVWANAAAREVTGRDAAEPDGVHVTAFFADGDHERVASAVAAVAEDGFARLTAGLETVAGDSIPYEFLGARIDGDHVLAVGWPAAEDADTRRHQAILDRMAEGFLALEAGGELTYLNETAYEFLADLSEGITAREDLYGESLWDALPESVAGKLRPRYEEAMRSQEPVSFELHRVTPDRFFEGDFYPSESGLSIYVREVTERRLAARERKRSERAIRRIYRVASNPELAFSEKVERLLDIGSSRLDLPLGFLTRIDSGTQTVVSSLGGHPDLEQGDACPLEEAYCRRTIDEEEPLVVADALGEDWGGDPAYERFGLGAYVGVKVIVKGDLYGTLCFADEEPRPGGFSLEERNFVELLSQWVRYELEHQRDEAVLRRQNERLEEFASIVSHDLRNPLNVAKGNVELAMETGETERLDSALDALERAEQLVGDVLALARQGRVVDNPGPTDLATVANAAWDDIEGGESTMEIVESPTVEADRERLRALLENLFRNSVEHNTGDPVHIEVGPLPDGFYVADDGVGISATKSEQIFEHGFTTNEDGTGIGLSIVRSIAEAHGWEVDLADGPGARFEFRDVELV